MPNQSHNFHLDKFRLCYRTPLGNIVSEAEAERIAQLERDKDYARELLEHPPERPAARFKKMKEDVLLL
jgi:hypothetical protein